MSDNKCFFCNTTCRVDEIPSLSYTSKYSCGYCGEYLLDPQDRDSLSSQQDNKFKIACVLNERRLKGLGGIALNDKTDMKDKVLGLPRISVDDILNAFPSKASDFLNRTLLNLSLLTKSTHPFENIRLELTTNKDYLHFFIPDKQGCYAFLRELAEQGYIRFNRVQAGEQLDVFCLTAKCWERVENLQQTDEIRDNSNDGNTSMEWDVFICHASEDKEGFVRPLAFSLISRDIKVWYDEFTLTVGDSLRRSIDKGLANSRYGIVVISPAFLSKDWPQKELDGLAALEVGGRKVILPVWHEIEVDEVRRYSPTLADRVATSSKKGLEQVVADLLDAMELRIRKQNIAGTKSKSTVRTQENLTEEELKLLLAVERSGNSGCYFPSLVQTLGISETRTKYYLDKLSHDKDLLNWIGNMNPGVPDRYTLARRGRDFLVEGGYV